MAVLGKEETHILGIAAGRSRAGLGGDLVIRGKTRASLHLLMDNLTGKVYQDHLSRLKYLGLYAPGRNFTVKLILQILPW